MSDTLNKSMVAVITVSTDEMTWLVRCLSSILNNCEESLPVTVYLVDNASEDGTDELAETQFPEVVYIRVPTRLGFSAANNVAIQRAIADGATFLFFVNPDTFSPSGLVRKLVTFLERWPTYGIIGPMQHVYDESASEVGQVNAWTEGAIVSGERHPFWFDWPDHPSSASNPAGRAPGTLEHSYVQGAALMVRACVLQEVGIFDELFHTYYEEIDLCRRVRWAGWRVALPGMWAFSTMAEVVRDRAASDGQ